MSAATASGDRLATPRAQDARVARAVPMIHALLLFVSGVVVALTASLHHDFGFDRLMLIGIFAALATLRIVEWSTATEARRGTALIFSVFAFLAAAVLLALQIIDGGVDTAGMSHAQLQNHLMMQSIGVAVVLAAWALAQGLLEFIGGALGSARRQDSVFFGATAILLAVLTLLTREDTIAVIGFFGVYLIIAGVFLGISAFDSRGARSAESSSDIATAADTAGSDA